LLRPSESGRLLHILPLEETGLVRAAFSMRTGGVSPAPTDSLNLSFSRGDDPQNVRENYRRVCFELGADMGRTVVSRQVHGDLCMAATGEMGGVRLISDGLPGERDALMTDETGLLLSTTHADCVPVYLLDPERPAIAMVHAGWRGTADRIAQKSLRAMREAYGTNPAHVIAAIGPSIGPCCFEVGEDVAAVFYSLFPEMDLIRREGERRTVDLWACNRLQLLEMGVPEGCIHCVQVCTACDTGRFFSHRREKGKTGAMAGFLMLL